MPAVYPKTKRYQIGNFCFNSNIFVLYLAITVSKANCKAGEVKPPKISPTDDHESSVLVPKEKGGQGEDLKVYRN